MHVSPLQLCYNWGYNKRIEGNKVLAWTSSSSSWTSARHLLMLFVCVCNVFSSSKSSIWSYYYCYTPTELVHLSSHSHERAEEEAWERGAWFHDTPFHWMSTYEAILSALNEMTMLRNRREKSVWQGRGVK